MLSAIQGEIATALVTIGIGIIMEKWYVSWWSVGINIINLIVVLTTLELSPTSGLVLGAYVVVGFLCAFYRVKRAYFMFGSKTYGALTLTLGLLQVPALNQRLYSFAFPILGFSANEPTRLLLFSWLWIALGVHICGEIYNHVGPSLQRENA
jgi:hypothetical protein